MSIYAPNNKIPFLFIVALLFIVMLLIIPLRPSQWQKSEELAVQEDSLFQPTLLPEDNNLEVVIKLDSQIVFVPATDSTPADSKLILTPVETTNREVVPPVIIEEPVITTETAPVLTEKAATDYSGLVNLLGLLLIFGLIAFLIYRILNDRLQKKYWLQYNANLQPLGSSISTIGGIEIDFNDYKDSPQAELIEPADLEQQTTTPKETVLSDEKEAPIEEEVADAISDPIPEEKEKEKEKEEEVVVEVTKEAPKTSSNKQVTQPQTAVRSTRKTIPFGQHPITRFFVEIASRPIKIIWATGQGLWKMFSFFFADTSTNSTAIDYKWQDAVSTILLLLFVACHRIIFPYSPSNIGLYLLMFASVWVLPSILRLHWGYGVFGIFAIFGELAALVIHAILEASNGLGSGSGLNWNIIYITLGVLLGFGLLIWAKINDKLPELQLGSFKATTFASITTIVVGLLVYYPFSGLGVEACINRFGFGGVLLYFAVLYQVFIMSKAFFEPTEDEKTQQNLTLEINHQAKQPESQQQLGDSTEQMLDEEQLTELFSMPNWWKKAPLHLLESVDMSNKNLNEDSEFIVLYLPDCVNLKHLHLYGNNFTSFPFEITELEQLEVLSLSYNSITSILPDIGYLKQLKQLYLATNQLSELPDSIFDLQELELLELRGNSFSIEAIEKIKKGLPNTTVNADSIADILAKQNTTVAAPTNEDLSKDFPDEDPNLVHQVKKLLEKELQDPSKVTFSSALMQQGLKDLPASILSQFTNLRTIFLNSNEFGQIPPPVYYLPALKNLTIPQNNIKEITDDISQLQALESLDLSSNPIKVFSAKMLELKKLRHLKLSATGLTAFPAFVLKMTDLESLNMGNNHILRIPEELAQMQQLKELYMDFTRQPVIPACVFELKHLRLLSWVGNDIQSIPAEINQLQELEELSLGHNTGLQLSDEQFAQLPKLSKLTLNGLQLDEDSDFDFGKLPKLRSLWVAYNNYRKIPTAVFGLKQLRSLSFSNNKLAELPEEIAYLTNLEYLHLDENQLTNLPVGIKNLKKLRKIYLSDNNINIKTRRKIQRILPNVEIVF